MRVLERDERERTAKSEEGRRRKYLYFVKKEKGRKLLSSQPIKSCCMVET